MKYFYSISAPLFFCLALSGFSLNAQAPACDSLAYFSWNAQCNSVTFTPDSISPTISYSWTFGDGGTSTAASPTHLYNNPPGTYTFNVNLSVVSGACMNNTTIMVTVTIPANGGVPTASIALPANPDLCAPAAITFAYPPSVLTGNGPGTSYTYTVQTGCAPPFTTTIPHTSPFTPFTHTFLRSSCDPMCTVPGASPGSFRVIMVATNSCGTTRDTLEVRIASPGTLGFTAPTVAFAGDLVCLADTSAPGYAWNAVTQTCGNAKYWQIMPNTFNLVSGNLGNAGNPGSSNPCIRFTQAGTYMVSLIRPAGSCPADMLKKTIVVKPPCDSLANFTSNVTCNSVIFTPTFIDSSAIYTWSFGDGSSSNEISPTHIYFPPPSPPTPPPYNVILTVVSGNCIKKDTLAVTVSINAGGLPVASMLSLGVGFTLKDDFLHCNGSNINPDYDLEVENTSTNTSPTTRRFNNQMQRAGAIEGFSVRTLLVSKNREIFGACC
ncbi:MAG: PKD domain-containing protein [Saprospiraceae bacterium]